MGGCLCAAGILFGLRLRALLCLILICSPLMLLIDFCLLIIVICLAHRLLFAEFLSINLVLLVSCFHSLLVILLGLIFFIIVVFYVFRRILNVIVFV